MNEFPLKKIKVENFQNWIKKINTRLVLRYCLGTKHEKVAFSVKYRLIRENPTKFCLTLYMAYHRPQNSKPMIFHHPIKTIIRDSHHLSLL